MRATISLTPDDPRLEQQWDATVRDGHIQVNVDLSTLPELAVPRPIAAKSPAPVDTPPPLNIVILLVGSRGDVQPYIALSSVLQPHHNVRIGTHLAFKELVENAGLGFYDIGGDPAELMAYMVKSGYRLPVL